MQCFFSVSRNEAEAIAGVRMFTSKYIIADPRFQAAVELANIRGKELEQIKNAMVEGEAKLAEVVTDNMVKAFAIAGTPDSCVRHMQRYLDIGITDFCILPPPTVDLTEIIQITSEEIMPKLKQRNYLG